MIDLTTLLLGIAGFLGMTIASKLIEGYFTKKSKAEDQIDIKIENDIMQVLDQLKGINTNITELTTKLSVSNERVDMLFKMSNDNSTRINKLTDDFNIRMNKLTDDLLLLYRDKKVS